MRVFLTGASGLVGRAVLGALRGRARVRALSRRPPSSSARDDVEWIAGDLEAGAPAGDALDGCDAVVACAGIMTADDRSFAVNREGTRRLLAEALRRRVPRFAYVSSAAVYGDEPRPEAREDARRAGTSPYARSKIEAEDLVLSSGLVTLVVRPCMISGPGDRNLAPAIGEIVRAPEVMLPAEGAKRVEIVDCRDVATLLADFAVDGGPGGVFNVTGGSPRTLREVLESAAAAVGSAPRWRPLSLEAARAELEAKARAGGLSPYDAALYSIASVERTFSIDKARRELGFAPDPSRLPVSAALGA